MLKSDEDDVYGVASSHAAGCITLANVFGSKLAAPPPSRSSLSLLVSTYLPRSNKSPPTDGFKNLDLDFIRDNAPGILASSPINYLKTAKLSGSLFNKLDSSGLVCGVDTNFFVDHTEPLEALEQVRKFREWPLGDLPDGCEFLVIVPAKKSTGFQSGGRL